MRRVVPARAGWSRAPPARESRAARSPAPAPQPPPPAAGPAAPPAPRRSPVKQVGPIVEPQLQLLARQRHQAQRIMRRIVAADPGQPHAAASPPHAARCVDRVVLEHHQRVEQLAQPGQPWISASPRCWCAISRDWLVLHLLAAEPAAAGRRQPHAQRQRVDEQPHHPLDAGDLRRPARHRDPEHNVVAAGSRPAELPRRPAACVLRVAQPARLLAEPAAQRRRMRRERRWCRSSSRSR